MPEGTSAAPQVVRQLLDAAQDSTYQAAAPASLAGAPKQESSKTNAPVSTGAHDTAGRTRPEEAPADVTSGQRLLGTTPDPVRLAAEPGEAAPPPGRGPSAPADPTLPSGDSGKSAAESQAVFSGPGDEQVWLPRELRLDTDIPSNVADAAEPTNGAKPEDGRPLLLQAGAPRTNAEVQLDPGPDRSGQTQAPASRLPNAESQLDLGPDPPRVEHAQTPHDGGLDRSEQGAKLVPLPDAGAPDVRAADAVPGSNAHLSPEPVIGTKVINQIVGAAKVHLFEGGGEMAMRLEPPHLGMVRMSVAVSQGTVTATLQTSTESTRQVLQADLSVLKQALSDAGINVDSIKVSLQSGANQGWSPHTGAHDEPAQGNAHAGAQQTLGLSGREVGLEPVSAARPFASGRIDYLA